MKFDFVKLQGTNPIVADIYIHAFGAMPKEDQDAYMARYAD